ncbi:MAG: hypothetical protein Q9220_003465 [cf. Caloplaca sp. 1 TL-2023]
MQTPALLLTVLALISTSLTAPVEIIQETHILTETHHLSPRQQQPQNIPQLLQLASIAGITLPTDPAALLSLGPVAARLQSFLPTSSVLSVLVTAAPPDFLSNIVHNPSYAVSFESAFAAGSSPSWFLALPTDVKNYLHTYSGYGGVATAVGEVESVTRAASPNSAGTATGSGATAMTTTGTESGSTSGSMSTSGSRTMAGDTSAAAATPSTSATGSTGGVTKLGASLTWSFVGAAGSLVLLFAL